MKNFLAACIVAAVGALLFAGECAAMPWRWFNYEAAGHNRAVFCLQRDAADDVWVGTNSGLFSFDGFDFYPAHLGDEAFTAQVYALAEAHGAMYVGTNLGLFTLDRATLNIQPLACETPREIRSLAVAHGALWIGSLNGLYRLDPADGSVFGPVRGMPHQAVYSLLVGPGGKLYAGTYNGLCAIGSDAVPRRAEVVAPSLPGGNVFVNSICVAPDSSLYLGLESGLVRFYPQSGRTVSVDGLGDVCVKSLAMLGERLAAGTDNGLFIVGSDGAVSSQRHSSRDVFSLASNVVWSLYAQGRNMLWAGTELGLSIADIDSPVQILSLADLTGSTEGQQVYRIMRDSRGTLWLGGANGLIALDQGRPARWYLPGNGDMSLSHNRVRDIVETSDGSLWVATDGGLNILDRASGTFSNHRIQDSRSNLNANWAYSILEDPSDSTVWTAGYLGGVFAEKLAKFRAEGRRHTPDRIFSQGSGLPNNLVGQMIADGEGNKWIMHYRHPELSRIDARSGEVEQVSLRGTTPSEPALLCRGPEGDIWCAVYGGLVKISPDGTVDPRLVEFPFVYGANVTAMCPVGRDLWVATDQAVFAVDTHRMSAAILPLPEIEYTAIYPDPVSDRVILGAVDELVVADPTRLFGSEGQHRVELKQIEASGAEMALESELFENPQVDLPNAARDIVISLAMTDFAPGDYRRFCYSLDNEPWRLLNVGANKIVFTTLPPGSHRLRMGVAGDEVNGIVLVLNVARPWYATWPALVCYFILAAMTAAVAVWRVRRRQQLRLEAAERRSVLAAVDRRIAFLGNISHELKTPLSLIIGPLSRLLAREMPPQVHADVEAAYRNAVKLNTLVHQTVEMNRVGEGSDAMLIFSRIDVVAFCRDIVESYRAANPGRDFVFSSPVEALEVRVDVVKLESLLNNLLSNAVKYSEADTAIGCSVRPEGEFYVVEVSDHGVGIPADEQSLVFQRLYRSPRTASSADGTGIGLYLVRRYANLLGGDVTLASEAGRGTTVTLTLPVAPRGEEEEASDALTRDEVARPDGDGRFKALIVDDNRPIASFICSVLASDFRCATAANGREGLAEAVSFKPDVIIADEMMPVMTGLEMCRRLKENPATAGIPILLLTAKDAPDTHTRSLDIGVEGFMTKPFEARALLAKTLRMVNAAGEMKRRLEFDRLTEARAADSAAGADEKRLAAVAAVIEANISNPDLNVAFVCDRTGIASKALYRLVKKYTGASPLDYIRQARLRQAAALLEQDKFSVSEVMYMVGFSSSSYFSKSFAQQFGCTPGQYAARKK